jgi:predicted DNA-binding protein
MSKIITLRLDEETYEEIKTYASIERRPLANFIEYATIRYINESIFVDDQEMAEILSNEKLLERLKKGSYDARKKKGKFVA